jgi:hypothetical protein
MKKIVTLFVCISLWHLAVAQVNVTPYVGMNSTKIYDGTVYQNGGAFVVTGVELEVALKGKEQRRVYISLATGASYLKNGFYYSGNFSYTALNFYTQRITDLKTRYLQIPFTLRLNWQPFPLVEDWKVFLGLGLCRNALIESTLEEKYTIVTRNTDILAPPQVASYEDSRDVTNHGEKNSWFQRIELGMKYKRFQVTYRLSRSLTDLYRTGLEDDWNVPDEQSWYIKAYHDSGKIIEKHTELVVGFRFGSSRQR